MPQRIVEPETVRCEPYDGALARLTKAGTDAHALVRRPPALAGALEIIVIDAFTERALAASE